MGAARGCCMAFPRRCAPVVYLFCCANPPLFLQGVPAPHGLLRGPDGGPARQPVGPGPPLRRPLLLLGAPCGRARRCAAPACMHLACAVAAPVAGACRALRTWHGMLSPTCAALPAQDVFNIFLGALFGGTVLAELRTFLEDPSHIWCGSIAWLAELMTAPAASLLAWLHGTTQMHGQALQLSACPHAATLQQCNPSNHTPVFAAGLRWAAPSLPPPISSCEHLVLGRQRCVQARAVGGAAQTGGILPIFGWHWILRGATGC